MGSEIIFVVPYALAFVTVATIVGTFVTWLVWTGLRRWGPRFMRETSTAFPKKVVVLVLLYISVPVGCVWTCRPAPQPESRRTVAAFEVPLPTATERTEFLAILSREVAAEGLSMSARTTADLEREAEGRTGGGASIWRGGRAYDQQAYFWREGPDHLWISFSRGEDPALAQRFRERVMSRILARWPGTLAVPVAATGALPNKQDLMLGKNGYEIKPAKLAGYTCDPALGPEAAPPESCR